MQVNQANKKSKPKLFCKYNRVHWIRLFRETVPIFVAVSVNRAVSELLQLLVGTADLAVSITVQFVYALCVSHVLGYLAVFYLPSEHPLFQFICTLLTDNNAFAWNTTLTLIILKWLYDTESPSIAIATWFILVVLVVAVIVLVNYLQVRCLHVNATQRQLLSQFESESFSLAIAYSFTVILASLIYLPELEDDEVISNNDDRFAQKEGSYLYFMYACLVTAMLGMWFGLGRYRYNLRKKAGLYVSLLEEDVKACKEQGAVSISGDQSEEEKKVDNTPSSMSPLHSQSTANQWEDSSEESESDEEEEEAREGPRGSGEEGAEHFEMGRVSSLSPHHLLSLCSSLPCQSISVGSTASLFHWDAEGLVGESLWGLLYKSAGYAGACAWHVWATSFFQSVLDTPWAQEGGLLLYAFTCSLIVAGVLAVASLRKEMRQSRGAGAVGGGRRHHMLLFTSFTSLLVGWAWSSFFTSLTAPLMPSPSRRGGTALLDVCLAFLVCLGGGRLEYLIVKRRERKEQRRREKERAEFNS